MAIPLIAAALYGMAGYQNNENRKRENARQDAADLRSNELHTAKMAELYAAEQARKETLDFKDANKVALSAGQQTPVTQGTGDAGSSFDVKDADVADVMADMGATKGETINTNAATRVSTGAVGATQNGTVAGKQVIADPVQAQKVANTLGMNEYQRLEARRRVADDFGKTEISDDIRGKLLTLQSEGAFQALALAKSGDFAGAAKVYQSTGSDRMPEGARFDAQEVIDPKTNAKRQVIRLVGANGEAIIPDVDMAVRDYLKPAERYKLDNDERRLDVAERDADTREKAQKANQLRLEALITGGGRSGGGGGRGGGSGQGAQAPEGLLDPMSGFDSKKAYALAGDLAVKELGEPGQGVAPATPQAIAKRATALYREMEDEFRATGQHAQAIQTLKGMVARAQTPEHLAVVLEHGKRYGVSPEQLAAIDPRLAQVAQAAQVKTGSETSVQQPNGKTAATTQRSAPAAPAPPPTMDEIKAQTRQNRARIVQQAEAAKAADRDPAVVQLVQQHKEALRAGKPMLANAIAAQINQVKAERYGVK